MRLIQSARPRDDLSSGLPGVAVTRSTRPSARLPSQNSSPKLTAKILYGYIIVDWSRLTVVGGVSLGASLRFSRSRFNTTSTFSSRSIRPAFSRSTCCHKWTLPRAGKAALLPGKRLNFGPRTYLIDWSGPHFVESRSAWTLASKRRPISQPHSSNRTCPFRAPGFPTDFTSGSRQRR